jgi:hypothetical protein
MDQTGARAHELAQAGGIRWVARTARRRVRDGGVESSMAAESTDCAFPSLRCAACHSGRRQAEPPLGLLRSAFRNASQHDCPDDDELIGHTTQTRPPFFCPLPRRSAESAASIPDSACPAPPITVPSLLLLPRTTHPSLQQSYLHPSPACHAVRLL